MREKATRGGEREKWGTTDKAQAVCVTTHKGSWVKLLLSLISIVTRSSSHLVGEMNQTQGSKHCFLFWKYIREERDLENFQDLMVPSDACYWLHKAISIRYGDDRKCDLANFNTWCPIWGVGDWALQFVSTTTSQFALRNLKKREIEKVWVYHHQSS